jgi:hypothetical protein
MAELGTAPPRAEVIASLAKHLGRVFEFDVVEPVTTEVVWSMS